jgi:hypothetical protein
MFQDSFKYVATDRAYAEGLGRIYKLYKYCAFIF